VARVNIAQRRVAALNRYTYRGPTAVRGLGRVEGCVSAEASRHRSRLRTNKLTPGEERSTS